MKQYVTLTESNDHEGETWKFFIQYDGNEEAVEYIKWYIDEFCIEDMFSIDLNKIPENEVDILVKHSTIGYMKVFNKVDGKLEIPKDALIEDDFYK